MTATITVITAHGGATLRPSYTAGAACFGIATDAGEIGFIKQWAAGDVWRAFSRATGHHSFATRDEAVSYIVAGIPLPGSRPAHAHPEAAPRRESQTPAETTQHMPDAPAPTFEETFTRTFDTITSALQAGRESRD